MCRLRQRRRFNRRILLLDSGLWTRPTTDWCFARQLFRSTLDIDSLRTPAACKYKETSTHSLDEQRHHTDVMKPIFIKKKISTVVSYVFYARTFAGLPLRHYATHTVNELPGMMTARLLYLDYTDKEKSWYRLQCKELLSTEYKSRGKEPQQFPKNLSFPIWKLILSVPIKLEINCVSVV